MDNHEREIVLTHPDNAQLLRRCLSVEQGGDPGHPFRLFGIELVTSEHLPRTHQVETGRVLWPADRFVEWEESDIPWALALGIARKETREEPLFYRLRPPKLHPTYVSPVNALKWMA